MSQRGDGHRNEIFNTISVLPFEPWQTVVYVNAYRENGFKDESASLLKAMVVAFNALLVVF